MSLPGQQTLIREISVPLKRFNELLSLEHLLHDMLWIHFQDGRTMRPVWKAVRAALEREPTSWHDLADQIRGQNLSKRTRAKIEGWLQRVAGVGS